MVLYPDLKSVTKEAGESVVLALKPPLPLRERENVPEGTEVLEGELSVSVESVLAGDNGIGLGLRIRNDSEETVTLRMRKASVNGIPMDHSDFRETIVLPAHTRTVKGIRICDDEAVSAGQRAEEIQFHLYLGNDESTPVILRFPEGTVFGAPGGTEMEGRQLTVVPAVFEKKVMVMSEETELPETGVRPVRIPAPLPPEEMEDAAECQAWICAEESRDGNLAVRQVLGGALQKDEEGRWEGLFCGLAVKAGERLFSVRNRRESGNRWILKPDPVLFFNDASAFDPSAASISGQISHAADAEMEMEIIGDGVRMIRQEIRMSAMNKANSRDRYEDRTAFPLEEMELAVHRYTVYDGLNWYSSKSRMEEKYQILPLNRPVTYSLIPLQSLECKLYIHYEIIFENGDRTFLLTDFETGEVLDRMDFHL